ncbi:MAG: 2-phospho-L-lactate transferase [Phenylobacterium sp.]|uniref:2-phospho-L-lactate transferase n=1 Tax=Phenylobacterium sp. TaxID=1871053 RepID=UPI002733967E|nr:2-phospho-L-lactate transferase [Phenylobacterium sp.]MDP3746375.1 2-phospho-L-lactate transferase [Phenylobacterium sp.]
MAHVIALCGGVGGAKLAFGLTRVLAPDDLTLVVNTGDDFEHLGLAISPDIDTVAYTLSELADRERGWGLAGETWAFMSALRALGGEDWFQLGDKDLATHVERTRRLAAGESLSAITAHLTRQLGLRHAIVPMSDQPVRTWVDTADGPLAFQRYFVGERCAPVVQAVRFEGASEARPSAAFAAALARPDLAAILICPSNPYLSIDPILAIPGVRDAIRRAAAPCVAVSPIVGGQAIKGPTAKLMTELGLTPGVAAVAAHYAGLADGLILDDADAGEAGEVERRGIAAHVTATVMRTDDDRTALARDTLAFAASLRAPMAARVG